MLTQHFCNSPTLETAQMLAVGWTDGRRQKVTQENYAGVKTMTHSHSPRRTDLTNKAKLGHSQE